MTVLDLIHRSLRLLGAINVGSTATADEQQDALIALNAMVDAWGTERLMIYTTMRQIFALTPFKQVYLIGPGGTDWIAPRPTYIDAAGLIMSSGTDVLERPMRILRTDHEWAAIRIKGVQSTIPTDLYYDAGYSNPDSTTAPVGSGQIALWPVPSSNNSVALYTPQAVSQFTSLTQTIALPPGYARALPYNLAVELAPEFDRVPSPVVLAIAAESKAAIYRANAAGTMRRLRTDIGTGGGRWDYNLGEQR